MPWRTPPDPRDDAAIGGGITGRTCGSADDLPDLLGLTDDEDDSDGRDPDDREEDAWDL